MPGAPGGKSTRRALRQSGQDRRFEKSSKRVDRWTDSQPGASYHKIRDFQKMPGLVCSLSSEFPIARDSIPVPAGVVVRYCSSYSVGSKVELFQVASLLATR